MSQFTVKIATFWKEFTEDLVKFNLRNLLFKLLQMEIWLVSYLLLNSWVFDFENRSIARFVRRTAAALPEHAHLLDAGAGNRPYARYFQHCRYESCDYPTNVLGSRFHDFHCDLSQTIPQPDGTYDAIICTQVLEHLSNPLQALREFYRVLKFEGTLYLTCPQGDPLHEEPHHYFNFIRYGLDLLLQQAGFRKIVIEARGGHFHVLGYRSMNLLYMLSRQKDLSLLPIISLILLFPLAQLILGFLIPGLCLLLDHLDYERKLTLGYQCICNK